MSKGGHIKETLLKNLHGHRFNPFASKRFGGLGASKDEMKSAVRTVKWFSPCFAPLRLQRREHPVSCPGEVWGRVGGTREVQPGVGKGLAGCSGRWWAALSDRYLLGGALF